MLEFTKAKATSDILKLNNAMNQLESSLPLPQRGEEENQERHYNNDNLYPIVYQQTDTNRYSLNSYPYE